MKNKTQILFLFLILLVISTNTVFACGKTSEKEKTEKTSCSKEDSQFEKKSCCNNHKNEDKGCNRDCDDGSCHCLTTINVPVIFEDFLLSNTNNLKLLNNNWTFDQHYSKAVYLSIWQPPKIS